MATFDEVMTALRNADASGNNEDASKLAQIAQRMRSTGGGSAGAQTSAPAQPSPPPTDLASGIRQEFDNAVGGAATGLAKGRSFVQSHILGNPSDDPATSYMRGVGKSYSDTAAGINYDGGNYGKAYQDGGVPGLAVHFGKEALVSAPHTAAALLGAGPLDVISNTERNAEDRARNDGRQDPGLSDYAISLPVALGQEVLSTLGARALAKPAFTVASKYLGQATGRVLGTTVTDAATGAAGNEVQYLGTHAGTKEGATPQGARDSAVEGAGAGAAGGAVTRGAIERLPVDRETARGLKGEAIVAKQGEEQSASDMRVAALAEQARKQAESGGTLGTSPQDSNAYKTVQNDLIGNLKGTIKRLEDVGDITPEQKAALIGADGGVLDLAKLHNHLFVPEKVDAVVDGLDLEDHVKQGLKDAYRDLNTSTYNSMFKNGTGPLEGLARKVASPMAYGAASVAGMSTGHPFVTWGAAPAAAAGIKLAGKAGDRLLGLNRKAPADTSLTALRAAALKRQSLAEAAGRDTLGTLRSASDDAVQRQQGLAEFKRAADAETEFQKQKDDLAASRLAATEASTKQQAKAVKLTAKQQAEIDRQRLMGAVSPDAPISGGHLAEVANWFRNQGHDASIAHVQEAVDRLNARGGFSSPEQYRAAREGQVFPGKTLVPLFKETGAVLADHGIGRDTDVKAGEKADAAITRAKVRALVSEAVPKAPRSPVGVPSVANTNQRPPQAPPRPRGPRKTPGGSAEAPPSTTGFEDGRRLHAYAATTFRAKMAEEQAIRSAGDRLDLQETASRIAGLEHKDAKAQAYEEALKKFHGDAEALRFVMGPLRTLAGIGGKSEQTANQKAVIRVRSKKTSK